MSKKLVFVISFVLVFGLSGTAQSASIDVNNYSFENSCDGNPVTCHTGHIGTPGEQCDANIAAWRYLGSGYTGIDVNCGTEDADCTNCHDWLEYPDGTANLFFQGNASVHQIFDFNTAVGHKYRMTADLLAFGADMVLEIFALPDPCYPDANHIVISQTVHNVNTYVDANIGRNTWERDLTAEAIVLDPAKAGMPLGIKIGGDYLIGGSATGYLWADNVRLEWDWATDAWDPDPADGSDEAAYQNLTLSWKPGAWVADVNGHYVYFGSDQTAVANADSTDTTGIYRGPDDVSTWVDPCDGNNVRYEYDVPETLDLASDYYWRIDEDNSVPPGGSIPAPPWQGTVWSFETEGRAKNPSPADGAVNQSPEVSLNWTGGALSTSHAVYFGSDDAAVESADTSDTTGIYRLTQAGTTYDPPEELIFGTTYYWRIDENGGAAAPIKGHVWSFTIAPFSVIDDFETYDLVTNKSR
jgi:hypothetical protein